MMELTVSMPCYLRPKRTIRMLECILSQDINGWEALVVGDNCPQMAKFLLSQECVNMQEFARVTGNSLSITNNIKHTGGWGYAIINQNIQKATGKYFMFLSNDDVIYKNHFRNYLHGIQGTDLDFAYYDTWLFQENKRRIPELRDGGIGHSELIIKTSFLKQMPPHHEYYGHDWHLIRNMMAASANHKYIENLNGFPTYDVMGAGDKRNDVID